MNENDPFIVSSSSFFIKSVVDVEEIFKEDMEMSRAMFWSFVNMCENEGDEEVGKLLDDFERLVGEEKISLIVTGQMDEDGINLGDVSLDLNDETKHHLGIFLAPDFFSKLVPDNRGFNEEMVFRSLSIIKLAVERAYLIERNEGRDFISRNEFLATIMPANMKGE